MDTVLSPLDLVSNAQASEGPIVLARPHRVTAAANWFRANFPGETFYAVKANPSLWVLDALVAAGVTSFDVASTAEVELVATRYPNARLAFMHPVKSRRAIARAYHDFGVKTFALDCESELEKILAETNNAKDLTLIVRLAASNEGSVYPLSRKFGASPEDAPALLRRARGATEEMMGVSFHVGSQCMRPQAFRTAMADASRAIVKAGVVVDIVDVGGGFPAIYPGMTPPPLADYMRSIRDGFEDMYVAQNAALWAEPGRALVAEAASVVARVDLRKDDALYLNDGAYGNLFDATHAQWPFPVRLLRQTPSRAKLAPFRFYGPTCDSLDAAASSFQLPLDVREGDLIEIGQLGAYGSAMATQFNGFQSDATMIALDSPGASLYEPEAAPVPRPVRAPRKAQVTRLRPNT